MSSERDTPRARGVRTGRGRAARRRVLAARWHPAQGNVEVQLASGHRYFLHAGHLGVDPGDVLGVAVDDLEDGVSVTLAGNRSTSFASDLVLYHCEPAYRRRLQKASAGDEPLSSRVGRKVRSIRESRGMSLRELARRTGMAPANASKLETGKHEPKLETLERVASALGTSLADLVSV